MLKRQKINFLVILFLLLLPIITVSASTSDINSEKLWDTASKIVSANANWIPGQIYFKREDIEEKQIKYTYESWSKKYKDVSGDVKEDLVKSLEKGTPIVSMDMNNWDRYSFDDFSPFKRNEHDILSIQLTNRNERINNQICHVYSFKKDKGDRMFIGYVFIDEITGAPLQIEYKAETKNPGENLSENLSILKYQYLLSNNSLYLIEWSENIHNVEPPFKVSPEVTIPGSEFNLNFYWKFSDHWKNKD